ncbi:MAG: hypothetical protein KGZ96_13050 [Clostridia bacterium]|nr:hypothetical protein [Clostridia bacterium]
MFKAKKNMPLWQFVITSSILLVLIALPAWEADANQNLEIELHHMIISEANGLLEVREIITVLNKDDQPVVVDKTLPEKEQYTFKVILPYGTATLNFPEKFDMGNDIIGTDTEFFFTIPLEPGITELDFFYTVRPQNGAQFLLNKEILYPTKSLFIITRGGVGLSGSQMVYVGPTHIGNEGAQQYYWEKPTVGEDIIFIAGKNVAVDGKISSDTNSSLDRGYRASFHSAGHVRFWYTSPFSKIEPHLFLVVFLSILTFGTYFFIRGRSKEDQDTKVHCNDETKFQDLLDRQMELLAKLAEVEKKHRSGEISQEKYNKQYVMYKEKLINVKLQLKLLSE